MPTAAKPFLAAAFVAAFVLGCPKSEITMIGQPNPELPSDCPVNVFPSTTPNYASKDIATVKTECQQYGRTTCIEQLKKDTCKLGGDTVYAINERQSFSGGIAMAATIARSTGGAPSQLAAQTCSPPCSPGFLCQGTTCVALCNPACAAGMHCANDRTCQPDQH
jgi:hypothetical protein